MVEPASGPVEAQFAAAEEEDVRMLKLEMETGGTVFDEAYFYRMEFKDGKGGTALTPPILSAVGTRAMVLRLSSFYRFTIPDFTINLEKYEESPDTWRWEGLVKMRNETTGYESLGAGTRRYRPDNSLFNRKTALSLAELKAIRGQIPVRAIERLYEKLGDDKVRVIPKSTTGGSRADVPDTSTRASDKQIKYACDLAAQLVEGEAEKEARRKAERDTLEGMSSAAASARIKNLKELVDGK